MGNAQRLWALGDLFVRLGKIASACVRAVVAVGLWVGAAAADTPVRHELTAGDVESFFDGLVPLQIESNDIAGVTIAIVKDGKLLFAKGYGFADLEARTPVSPEKTLFRTGSVTKLFTWTAVMQLVEQGKLDLDADVSTYLDFKIEPAFGKVVTLRNLMTHRAGFQETLKHLGAQNSGKVDLGRYVRENKPDQIFAPGSTPSYSNYGAALAGYIVERVSGVAFDAYVDANIFTPLGMANSTLSQPLSKALAGQMSKGYNLGSAGAKDFEVINGYPAGSQSSSAIDMTKFMLAHLNGGAVGELHILKPETVALMHDSITKTDPRVNGMALGFYEERRNGMQIIGHGGDTVYFHSDLHLIPAEKLGFFVSYNSAGRGSPPPRGPLWGKFLDRYFPFEPPVTAVKTSGLSAMDVAGSYISSRRAETSALKFLTELSQPTATANADGTLTVDAFTGLNGQPIIWTAMGDGEFRAKSGQGKLVFLQAGDGAMTMLSGAAGVAIFQRVPDLRNALVTLIVFCVSMLVVTLNLLAWPVAAFVRRHYGVEQGWTLWERTLRLAVMLTSLAVLIFVVGFGVVLIGAASDSPWGLDSSLDPKLHQLQQVGIIGAAGVLVVLLNVIQAWSNPVRGFWGRVKESLVLAALAGLLWFAWSMNLFDQALRF